MKAELHSRLLRWLRHDSRYRGLMDHAQLSDIMRYILELTIDPSRGLDDTKMILIGGPRFYPGTIATLGQLRLVSKEMSELIKQLCCTNLFLYRHMTVVPWFGLHWIHTKGTNPSKREMHSKELQQSIRNARAVVQRDPLPSPPVPFAFPASPLPFSAAYPPSPHPPPLFSSFPPPLLPSSSPPSPNVPAPSLPPPPTSRPIVLNPDEWTRANVAGLDFDSYVRVDGYTYRPMGVNEGALKTLNPNMFVPQPEGASEETPVNIQRYMAGILEVNDHNVRTDKRILPTDRNISSYEVLQSNAGVTWKRLANVSTSRATIRDDQLSRRLQRRGQTDLYDSLCRCDSFSSMSCFVENPQHSFYPIGDDTVVRSGDECFAPVLMPAKPMLVLREFDYLDVHEHGLSAQLVQTMRIAQTFLSPYIARPRLVSVQSQNILPGQATLSNVVWNVMPTRTMYRQTPYDDALNREIVEALRKKLGTDDAFEMDGYHEARRFVSMTQEEWETASFPSDVVAPHKYAHDDTHVYTLVSRQFQLDCVYDRFDTSLHGLIYGTIKPVGNHADGTPDCTRRSPILKTMMRHVLCGLRQLHEHDCIHGNLRPSRIVATRGETREQYTFQLHDFKFTNNPGNLVFDEVAARPAYRPPEYANAHVCIGPAIDLYALGLIVVEVMEGSRNDLFNLVRTDGWHDGANARFARFAHWTSDALDLLKQMLCPDPRRRITAAAALNHPFLRTPHSPPKGTTVIVEYPLSSTIRDGSLNPKMYQILCSWIGEVILVHRFHAATMFCTLEMIASYVSRRLCARRDLQLLGCAAIMLACKRHEMFLPNNAHIVRLADGAFTATELYDCELKLAMEFEFKTYASRYEKLTEVLVKEGILKSATSFMITDSNSHDTQDATSDLTAYFVYVDDSHKRLHSLALVLTFTSMQEWSLMVLGVTPAVRAIGTVLSALVRGERFVDYMEEDKDVQFLRQFRALLVEIVRSPATQPHPYYLALPIVAYGRIASRMLTRSPASRLSSLYGGQLLAFCDYRDADEVSITDAAIRICDVLLSVRSQKK